MSSCCTPSGHAGEAPRPGIAAIHRDGDAADGLVALARQSHAPDSTAGNLGFRLAADT